MSPCWLPRKSFAPTGVPGTPGFRFGRMACVSNLLCKRCEEVPCSCLQHQMLLMHRCSRQDLHADILIWPLQFERWGIVGKSIHVSSCCLCSVLGQRYTLSCHAARHSGCSAQVSRKYSQCCQSNGTLCIVGLCRCKAEPCTGRIRQACSGTMVAWKAIWTTSDVPSHRALITGTRARKAS